MTAYKSFLTIKPIQAAGKTPAGSNLEIYELHTYLILPERDTRFYWFYKNFTKTPAAGTTFEP
ncbi:MAG: hypothetical protein B5M56_04130 [Desulfococcus sp. 4484_241]|nr:MAG: hypothetical protein B5M56_04130 [Desulfococcus sp. 4484_241]RLC33779.1 MAG: hypothetical protein DRH32_00350 [Deltaproteobacteria bacterium]